MINKIEIIKQIFIDYVNDRGSFDYVKKLKNEWENDIKYRKLMLNK